MTTTPQSVTIASPQQAMTLAAHHGAALRGATLEGVHLVAYTGSLREHHGLCWRVGSCGCEQCSTWAGPSSCSQSVLATVDGALLQHVRPSSLVELAADDEQVPPRPALVRRVPRRAGAGVPPLLPVRRGLLRATGAPRPLRGRRRTAALRPITTTSVNRS